MINKNIALMLIAFTPVFLTATSRGEMPAGFPGIIRERTLRSIGELAPKANISTNVNQLTVKFDTQTFNLRAKLPDGSFSPRTTAVEGPKENGFIINLRFRSGNYDEAKARGPNLIFAREPRRMQNGVYYVSDSLREFSKHSMYMVSEICYAEGTDLKLVEQIYKALMAAVISELGE